MSIIVLYFGAAFSEHSIDSGDKKKLSCRREAARLSAVVVVKCSLWVTLWVRFPIRIP